MPHQSDRLSPLVSIKFRFSIDEGNQSRNQRVRPVHPKGKLRYHVSELSRLLCCVAELLTGDAGFPHLSALGNDVSGHAFIVATARNIGVVLPATGRGTASGGVGCSCGRNTELEVAARLLMLFMIGIDVCSSVMLFLFAFVRECQN